MDFVRLGAPYSTTYYPDGQLIEGYNSLIWTERFNEPGEFELKSFDVDGLRTLLPEDTLVSHLETQEVMQVETHSIQMVGEGADARPEITIAGRSATIILDHRWVESSYQKKRKMRKKYSGTTAACVLIWQAVDNNSGYDVTRGDDDPGGEYANNFTWNTKDDIPNVVVTESVSAEGTTNWWHLEQGMLLPQLMKILAADDLGIRCMRPVLPNSVTVFTVQTPLATRGTPVRTVTANVEALRFEVYTGIDRTVGDNVVQFSLLQGHIDAPQYLTSNKEFKTEVEVISGEVTLSDIYRNSTEAAFTGWKRKTMGFDAGSPEIPSAPDKPDELGANATAAQRRARAQAIDVWQTKYAKWKNKRARIVADFDEAQTKAGLAALKAQRKVDMFAGDISDLSPYKYKTHYNLGDSVMLYGDYGKSAKMIVAEYVRTEDVNGDRGFPGLVAP